MLMKFAWVSAEVKTNYMRNSHHHFVTTFGIHIDLGVTLYYTKSKVTSKNETQKVCVYHLKLIKTMYKKTGSTPDWFGSERNKIINYCKISYLISWISPKDSASVHRTVKNRGSR